VSAARAALVATRDETLRALQSPPGVLARSYAPGKWSMRQLLLHLVDSEGVLLDRLRRLAADDKPLLWAYDENRWVEELAIGGRSLETAAALFAATRNAVIELSTLLPADRHGRAGIHSEAGRKTFAEVLEGVHHHNAHHLEQVRACAAGTLWRAAG
jgi:hypothetical protein